jgi:fructose-1,6-bisphosphatase/inositol monophosphatase family enzyme
VISNGDVNTGNLEDNNAKDLSAMKNQATQFQRIKCFGSAVVKSSYVAAGRLEAYVMQVSHLWDNQWLRYLFKKQVAESHTSMVHLLNL